eukprot:8317237-Alexandrium_andersonii.AAC.1
MAALPRPPHGAGRGATQPACTAATAHAHAVAVHPGRLLPAAAAALLASALWHLTAALAQAALALGQGTLG